MKKYPVQLAYEEYQRRYQEICLKLGKPAEEKPSWSSLPKEEQGAWEAAFLLHLQLYVEANIKMQREILAHNVEVAKCLQPHPSAHGYYCLLSKAHLGEHAYSYVGDHKRR